MVVKLATYWITLCMISINLLPFPPHLLWVFPRIALALAADAVAAVVAEGCRGVVGAAPALLFGKRKDSTLKFGLSKFLSCWRWINYEELRDPRTR